jgi:hypothetical protein
LRELFVIANANRPHGFVTITRMNNFGSSNSALEQRFDGADSSRRG